MPTWPTRNAPAEHIEHGTRAVGRSSLRVIGGAGVAAIALCCGCSGGAGLHYFDPQGKVSVSTEFTLEQREVVLGAIDAWRDATGGSVDLQVNWGDAPPRIRPLRERDGVVGEFIPSDAPEIVLDTNKATDPADLRPLTLHELGHAFRLEHIDHVDSVMFPMANRVQELDPWTLRAFAELRLRSAD